jgi:hypothetical protein
MLRVIKVLIYLLVGWMLSYMDYWFLRDWEPCVILLSLAAIDFLTFEITRKEG